MKVAKKMLNTFAATLLASSLMMCAKPTLIPEKPQSVVQQPSAKPDTSNNAIGTLPDVGTDPTLPDTSAPAKIITNSVTTTISVQPSQWYIDGSNLPAGSIIYIPAGTRGALLLKNIKGTALKPIIIVNKGGQVVFLAAKTASYALKTQNCKNFKILGTGTAGVNFGFVVDGGNLGISMDDLSTDFEIANLEVKNSGFAGIMAKTDPTCDPATQRGNFTMSNVVIHHNYIHNTGGEGIYVGNSFYKDGVSAACGTVMPHDVKNLRIYKNVINFSGCEGIQVGSAVAGCSVYYNTIISPGAAPFASGQNNGIQIGEGTGGRCFNNLVKNAPGNGIIVLGLGDNTIFNNYIINAGENGIFADSRYTPGPYFRFINNTIIAPAKDGIKLNSVIIPVNLVINNVIIKPGTGVFIHPMNSSVKVTALDNYMNNDINACKFIDFNGGNYRLQSTSPLINTGTNASSYGVTFDYYGIKRPAEAAFDIGAAEHQ